VGKQLDTTSELDMDITSKVEHHDDLEDISLESCVEIIETINSEFANDILSIEYEFFSYRFDVNVGLDVDLSAEHESFSFDLVPTGFLFKSCMSEFVESDTLMPMTFILADS